MAAEKSVLFIHTSKSSGPAVILYDMALPAALSEGTSERISLSYEYTDLWRFTGEDYARTLKEFYRQKYAGQHFDVIVVESPPALRFLLAHGDELFPGTPVVFCVMEERLIEGLTLKSNFTGVLAGFDFKKSLETALRLQPDTRRVVVVGGTSPLDQSYLATARKDFQQFAGQVEFTYLTDLPFEEIERQVSQLPEHTIVFYVTLFRDGAGHPFLPVEAAARLGRAANAPFYSFTEIFTTPADGVGGYVASTAAEATEVAKTVRRILAGEKPQDVPIRVADTNRYIFDWRQLSRWGIDERKLPPGSIVRFKEPTFWDQYKWHIVGVVSLVILEAVLIVGLLINRRLRRQAEEENDRLARLAVADHQRLDEVISNVPGIVWEARAAPGTNHRLVSFVSEHVEKMLGYTAEEWLSTPGFAMTIVTEEDRERATREAQAILESGKDGVLQFRWVAKDGRILWVESQVSVIHDDEGKPVGLRGVTMDVTDRKRAELEAGPPLSCDDARGTFGLARS
jgi:PAS domain S-box-containing protein